MSFSYERIFFFSRHSCWSTSILKPTAPWAAMHDPMIHAFGEWLNLCWLWQKQAGEEKLTRELTGVCVPLHSSISTFIMGTQDKTTAMIALCLMLRSLNNFISRPFCFVKSCRAVVEKANHWEDDSWQLWVVKPLRTSFSWTEPRLRANCASLHIGVDEVLINRCRLLDIHAWEVFRTPWQCSLPVCLYFKLHFDEIKMENCWEMITSPRINEPETGQQQCYA